jgi:hypothetical protein
MSTQPNPFDGRLIRHPDELSAPGIPTPGLIPELGSDPVSPEPETAWVLRKMVGVGGRPIGLLLALTYSGAFRHYFSYQTLTATTKRVELLPDALLPGF